MERRQELWTIYRLSKLPTRPSDLIGLAEGGSSPQECLAFDLMTLEFGERFERAMAETVERPLPNDRRRPTIPVPKYSPADLARFLGIDEPWPDKEGGGEWDPVEQGEIDRMVQEILRGSADWLE
jgi:hypothetical protein